MRERERRKEREGVDRWVNLNYQFHVMRIVLSQVLSIVQQDLSHTR